jgi:hypothetical protein
MANDFITPSVIARRGLATLYNTAVLGNLVWRDFDPDFTGKQGDTVTIRKPAVFTAEEFSRSAGVTIQEADEDSTTVVLNKIANVSFAVTDEEMTLEVEDFENQLLVPAMEAIIQKVDGDLAEALIDAAEGSGGGGTATMSSVASDALIKARTNLGRGKLPTSDRHSVLSPEGAGVALSDDLFVQADQSGSTDALREGSIGRVFGFDTYESQVFGLGSGDKGVADGVAFHRSAVTLAVRPLDVPRGLPADKVAVENYKGLSLRTTYSYNSTKKQDEVSCDLLYGIAATRPVGAVQLSFGQGS